MLWVRRQMIRAGRLRQLGLFFLSVVAIAWLTNRAQYLVRGWSLEWTSWGDESLGSKLLNQFVGFADLSPLLLSIRAIALACQMCERGRNQQADNLRLWRGKFRWFSVISGGLLVAWIGSLLLGFLWSDLTSAMPDAWAEAWPLSVLSEIFHFVASPVTLAIIYTIWLRTVTVTITEVGVRISLLGDSVAVQAATWERIKWVRLVDLPHGRRSVVIPYAGKLGLPLTIVLSEDSYVDGVAMVDSIIREASERTITVYRTAADRWVSTAATIFILGGCGLTVGSYLVTNSAWYPLIYDPEYSFTRFREAAAVAPLTALSVGTVASFSIGLGLLSALHRGGPAWPALWVWAWWSQNVSTPVLHWLVWQAIFAIHTAIKSPVLHWQPVATGPSQQEWMFGLEAIRLLPVFAVVFYFLGLGMGRRTKALRTDDGLVNRQVHTTIAECP
ncbi:MAG: hypothetical protein HONBIEJF_01832 [Fimbriimonadaceae bacterium]|nr:hypothetical protein [Fimbriimonadaceae bacterium]